MNEPLIEFLDIHCKPDRPDLAAWKEKIAALAGQYRGVMMENKGEWFTVGFPDDAIAWEACKAIYESGEFVVGPMPLDDD